MAQLKNDCDAFGDILPSKDIIKNIKKIIKPINKTVKKPLLDSIGHFVANDIIALYDVPPTNNAAVDGYAVVFDKLLSFQDTMMPSTQKIIAGDTTTHLHYDNNKALRIFTGAILPDNFDTIFMQEDVVIDENAMVTLPPGLKKGDNVRMKGEDINKGDIILKKGDMIQNFMIGQCAAQNIMHILCYQKPKIAIISTGNEIYDIGKNAIPYGSQYDSNRYNIMALCQQWGYDFTDYGIVKDNLSAIIEILTEAANDNDMIIISGGASTGDEDHVVNAIKHIGQLEFWRIAIKPGRPAMMGVIDNNQKKTIPILGLPGNPAAALTIMLSVGKAVITVLSGGQMTQAYHCQALLDFNIKKKAGRLEFIRVTIHHGDDGVKIVRRCRNAGAGILSSYSFCDGVIIVDEDIKNISCNTMVNVILRETLLDLTTNLLAPF